MPRFYCIFTFQSFFNDWKHLCRQVSLTDVYQNKVFKVYKNITFPCEYQIVDVKMNTYDTNYNSYQGTKGPGTQKEHCAEWLMYENYNG